MRFDGDEQRNAEIRSERLTPAEIIALEKADRVRYEAMQKSRAKYFLKGFITRQDDHLFVCGAGMDSFVVAYDGTFRLCSSLWAPGTTVNLRQVSLQEAWENFVPAVRDLRVASQQYLDACGKCPIVNLCLNYPAHAYLETGSMEAVVDYFCQVAHARAEELQLEKQ